MSVPSLMWDSQGITPGLLDSMFLDDLMPDACEALWILFQKETDIGYRAINRLFETFTSKWIGLLRQRNFDAAAQHWIDVLKPVRTWEQNTKKRIHKGTAYYFLGATYFYSSNYDLGFRYLFDAIEEDRKASPTSAPDAYKKSPAYMLASLVENDRNYLYNEIVIPARSRREEFLEGYKKHTQSSMGLIDFDGKFLNKDDLEFPKLYFVFVLLQLIKLEKMWDPIEPQNDFVKMRNRDILLGFCLIIDEVIRKKCPGTGTMGPAVYDLAKSKGWVNSSDLDAGDLNQNLSPKITGASSPTSDIVVPALLDLTITYRGAPVSREMSWLLLSWHLRNYAAHGLSPRQVLIDRYHETVQSLISALFFSVE